MQKRNNINLFVGPMSINTVNSVNIFTKKNKKTIHLICSRNQIESKNLGSGYVYNFSTELFSKYIKKLKNKYIKLARDHGGPFTSDKKTSNFKIEYNKCKKSFETDIRHNFKILHIDTSFLGDKKFKYALDLFKFCQNKSKKFNKKIKYEVGVNFHGDKFNYKEFKKILKYFGNLTDIKYITGSSGSEVGQNRQIGKFDFKNSNFMTSKLKKKKKLLKDHNCDFLNLKQIKLRKKSGITSFNIGPEMAYVESKLLYNFGKKAKSRNFKLFLKKVISKNKWKKWCGNKSSLETKFLSSAHYFYNDKYYLNFQKECLLDNNFNNLVINAQQKILNKFYQK